MTTRMYGLPGVGAGLPQLNNAAASSRFAVETCPLLVRAGGEQTPASYGVLQK